MSDFKRARSDEQKEQRMQEIKDAADAMFSREPYHRITLSALADALGCSRTQIYKYAATKEEIFLELSSDKRKEYFDAMMAAFPEGCSYPLNVFAEVWAGILNAHRDFLRYGDILLSIIETNVSVERLALYKRQYYDDLGRILDMLQGQLHIDRDSAKKLYTTVYFQAVGLNAYCLKSPPAWKALDMANLSTDPLDFREAIRDFILMCLDRYCPDANDGNGEPPGDRQHGRTHALLEQLQGSGARISIATKSDLVLRDLDLIASFPDARVSWSINTLDEGFREDMDRAVPVERSLEAMRRFHDAGIRTTCFISPNFPGITDPREIVLRAKDICNMIWLENLNLRGSFKSDILGYIEEKRPDLVPLYDRIYNRRDLSYWEDLDEEMRRFSEDQGLEYVTNDDSMSRPFDAPPIVVNYFYHERIRKSSRS